MIKLLFVFLVSILGAAHAQGQTPEIIAPGEPIRLTWTYPVVDYDARPVQFRLWLAAAIVRNFNSTTDLDVTIANGLRTYVTKVGVVIPFTSAQVGSQAFWLSAYDASGESTATESVVRFDVRLSTLPTTPSNFKRYKLPGLVEFDPATGELRLVLTPISSGG